MDREDATGDALKPLEDQFLAAVGRTPPDADEALALLPRVRAMGQDAATVSWTQTLRDALVEAGDTSGLLRLFEWWSSWRAENDRSFAVACRDTLHRASKDRFWTALVDSAGFGTLPTAESLRRLRLLRDCQPGRVCLDRTWGIGVIRRLDDFYKRMAIDFAGKPGHQMTFAYAAEALDLPAPSHLLVRRHETPQEIQRLVREDPAEVVRMALRSFGPLSVSRLEALLAEHGIVSAVAWRGFWETARKGLRSDPLVEIPGRRSEPITIRASVPTYGDAAWLDTFRGLRDPEAILAGLAVCEASVPAAARDPANRPVLAERMAFAIKAAHNTDPALYARLAVTAARLGLEPPSADALRAHLWEDRRFLRAGERLTARDTGLMVEFLVAGGGDAAARLLEALPEMSYALTAETAERLRAGPSATALQLRCRELLASTAVPHTLLVWVLRNRETVATWPLPSVYEQMAHALAVVDDATLTGENLRMQNQIHALFENARWFEAIFNELNSIQREAVFDRIQGSPSWDPTSHRSLLGRMIRLAPELAERRRSTAVPAPRQTGRWTSWRSLRERQVLYKRLVEVEIPKNSQDIATARSYGDLRENFEYHAARHQQGLLMQRKAEWDADLQQIRGTDFAGMATDRAGPGTRVTLVHADGRETVVNILGEWDRDETLGIVSNRSRLAQSIEGRQPGETASIPAETGEETVTVREVAAPDDAVRAWIGGGQPEIV